ncbi:sem-1 putative 26S proteasome complex subunit sem-1 [Candida maltosa Xu316]
MSDAQQLDSTTPAITEEEKNVIKTLEEDDEFEDFPEDDAKWSKDSTTNLNEQNLWEEDWDDDDSQDQFSIKLKEELKKSGKPAK